MKAGQLTVTAILTAALFAPLPATSASGAAHDAEGHTPVEVEGLSVAAVDDPVSITLPGAFAPGWTGGGCALFIQAKWYLTMQPAIDAAAKGRCFALNIPRFVPGVSMNGTIVNCTR